MVEIPPYVRQVLEQLEAGEKALENDIRPDAAQEEDPQKPGGKRAPKKQG